MLPATSLIVFSTSSVSCLLLPVSSSPVFFKSLFTQSSHLSIGLPRLLLPCSRNLPLSSVVCHPPSFLRVQPAVVCSSPVSLSSSSAFPSLPSTPPFFSCLPSLPWATPVVSGHLPCTATLSMSRHISTLNYLRSADTCLKRIVIYWLSVPAITDSTNKCCVSVVISTRNCSLIYDPQFAQISMLPSGDSTQYFISRINACVMMNHVIVAVRPIGYICFTTSRRKSHVLVLTSPVRIELVRQNADRSK